MTLFNVKHKAPDPESLKSRMVAVGLSQRKAASLVAVSASYLNQILNRRLAHPGYAMRHRLDAVLTQIENGTLEITPRKWGGPNERRK